jgi:hypothetical protein
MSMSKKQYIKVPAMNGHCLLLATNWTLSPILLLEFNVVNAYVTFERAHTAAWRMCFYSCLLPCDE